MLKIYVEVISHFDSETCDFLCLYCPGRNLNNEADKDRGLTITVNTRTIESAPDSELALFHVPICCI